MTKEVAFEPVDGTINNRDDAYRLKYGSPYLSPMIGARPLCDHQGHAARDHCVIIDEIRE